MATARYRPEQFEPSGWDSGTPERKARFVNSLLRFIADDFPRDRFTKALYLGLSNHGYFGFIAHYDIHGFYAEQMSTPERRTQFLADLAAGCHRETHHNRPDLWSDVKAVLAQHLLADPELDRSRRLGALNAFGARPSSNRQDAPTLF